VFDLRLPQRDFFPEGERAWILAERAAHGKRKLRRILQGSHNRFTGFPQGFKSATGAARGWHYLHFSLYLCAFPHQMNVSRGEKHAWLRARLEMISG
jgi:hypothetical protein